MSSNLLSNSEGLSMSDEPDIIIDSNTSSDTTPSEPDNNPLEELLETLKEYEDHPDIMQLNEWKEIHQIFFASSSNGEDIYLWRTIKRREYKTIAESGAMEKQDLFESSIVRKCLLWPKPEQALFLTSDAGLVPTLFKQIMYKSGFVSDETAISMIRRI